MRALSSFVVAGLAAGCIIGTEPQLPEEEEEEEEELIDPWGVPITGGTMLVTRNDLHAVVADPDRDRVVTVHLDSERVIGTIELAAGSEPGRVIEDGAGRIHVALRGSGELLTITGDTHELRAICGEPRGLAWQADTDVVHVACATGELVSVPAGGGAPTRTLRIERDLRDVIVLATGNLVVTTFRTAELIELDAQGVVVGRLRPPTVTRVEREKDGGIIFAVGDVHNAVPSVAWRTIALPDGRIAMLHQRRVGLTLSLEPGGYGGMCNKPVENALTIIGTDGVPFAVRPPSEHSVPIDLAVDPTSGNLAVVTAGAPIVWIVPTTALTKPDDDDCVTPPDGTHRLQTDTATSAAYRANGKLLTYQPAAGAIQVDDRHISLGGNVGIDPGRELFHRETSAGIACASCHPEGRDDGGVWTFEGLGQRRTQSLAGSILSRGPYHWGADMDSLPALLDDVFTMRMGGGFVEPEVADALGAWLDRIQPPRGVVVDAGAVARGQALFMAEAQACTSCHVGPLYTNNQVVDVGHGKVKVPSLLGIGGRAPFMHDGCAATLRDRFGVCGGGDSHGKTSHLSEAQLADLVAYLESL
ncbi:MAG TPA: cytochrome c [Kofleriaceae bacterium]